MALILTAVFVILADYLFNENSCFCCFSDHFKHHYLTIDTNDLYNNGGGGGGTQPVPGPPPSESDVKRAMEVLEQVKQQRERNNQPNYITPFSTYK